MSRSLLLAEELLLLAHQKESGKCPFRIDYGLAGLLLSELVLTGRITIKDRDSSFVRDNTATGDPELDWALHRVTVSGEEKLGKVLLLLGMVDGAPPKGKYGLTDRLRQRLIRDNTIEQTEKRTFGLFRSDRYPTIDTNFRSQLLYALTPAFTDPPVRDSKTAALLLGLQSCAMLPAIVSEINTEGSFHIGDEDVEAAEAELLSGQSWGSLQLRDQLRYLRTTMQAGRRVGAS